MFENNLTSNWLQYTRVKSERSYKNLVLI